jgi:predicted NBD/HSP70 family sugar kinase
MARPGSQAYLSRRSGLSQATVSTLVAELEDMGWVTVNRAAKGSRVGLARTTGAAVGIELGHTQTAVVARRAEQSQEEAVVRLAHVGAASGTAAWLPEVTEAIREAVNELGEDEITTIGLAVPSVVDLRSGKLAPPTLLPRDLNDDPALMILEELHKWQGAPRLVAPRVVIDNDANLAALAESVYAWDDAEILVGITASTGIGAGVVIGGRIFRGHSGAAGEIGHIVVDPGGGFCTCGGRGCLETVIGMDALLEQAKAVVGGRRMPSPNTAEALIHMATEGNASCQRVLEEAARTLGFAIGNLCNVLNPSVVVLGGAFGRGDAVRFTLDPCQAALRQTETRAAQAANLVVPSQVPHAAAVGALVVAFQGTAYGRPG